MPQLLSPDPDPTLVQYVESEIIPRYHGFDSAHREDHVRTVIEQSLHLASFYAVLPDIVYAAAAYHDTGLAEDRDTHHLVSGRIIREDKNLLRWFTPAQIETIAAAAEDHRASAKRPPRTIYGRILAEADRVIDPTTIVRRTIQYSLDHYPDYDREQHWERTLEHLRTKYGYGGYLKLHIPQSDNAQRLEILRRMIVDEKALRRLFDSLYDQLNTQQSQAEEAES